MAGFGSIAPDATFDERFPAEPSTAAQLATNFANGAKAWWDGVKWVAGGREGPQPAPYRGGPSYPLQAEDLQNHAYRRQIPASAYTMPSQWSNAGPLWGALDARPGQIEDRRGEQLSPVDEARMIMGQTEGTTPMSDIHERIKQAGVTPMGVNLGMLHIAPLGSALNLREKLKERARVKADPTIHSFDEAIDPNAPPVRLDRRK